MSLCIFTVSNGLLMPSDTVIMGAGGYLWLKPVSSYIIVNFGKFGIVFIFGARNVFEFALLFDVF